MVLHIRVWESSTVPEFLLYPVGFALLRGFFMPGKLLYPNGIHVATYTLVSGMAFTSMALDKSRTLITMVLWEGCGHHLPINADASTITTQNLYCVFFNALNLQCNSINFFNIIFSKMLLGSEWGKGMIDVTVTKRRHGMGRPGV